MVSEKATRWCWETQTKQEQKGTEMIEDALIIYMILSYVYY